MSSLFMMRSGDQTEAPFHMANTFPPGSSPHLSTRILDLTTKVLLSVLASAGSQAVLEVGL